MRRISIGVASASVALALAACGSDGDGSTGGVGGGTAAPNGIETKTGPEVLRAAAAELRKVESVHVVLSSEEFTMDMRMVAPESATGTISGEGIQADIVQVDGVTYLRYGDLPPEAEGIVEVGQWVDASGSEEFSDFTITSLADDLEANADDARPTVQRTTEGGQPAVLVESDSGVKIWVSNVGPALPIRQIDEEGADGTLTEYGADVDIQAPPANEIVPLPSP